MLTRCTERSPDRDLARLVAGLRDGRGDAFTAFCLIAHQAGCSIAGRYRHPLYRLDGSADDVGQQFVLHLVARRAERGGDYIADLAAAATSTAHLRRLLARRARHWAIDRSRSRFPTRLLRRIKHLPERRDRRFTWVVRPRYLARTLGPKAVTAFRRTPLARWLVLTPAGHAVVDDYRRRSYIGASQLADAVEAMLAEIAGAAAPGPLTDVLLLICGQADTRPPILAGDVPWWDRVSDRDDEDDDLAEGVPA